MCPFSSQKKNWYFSHHDYHQKYCPFELKISFILDDNEKIKCFNIVPNGDFILSVVSNIDTIQFTVKLTHLPQKLLFT